VYFVPEKQNLSSRHCILGASGTWAFFSQNIDASDRMARKIKDEHLLRITKANAKEIKNFRLGIHLHSTFGYDIDTLVSIASRDRLRLAPHESPHF
jgi:hypothetical protein